MKRLFSIIATALTITAVAQDAVKAEVDQAFEIAEASKSGNYKDVLSSLYQLAAKNIVGDDKSIDFNTTLFALKLKANPDLNKDVNYARETFSRNLQFNFKANFDDDYKYTGMTGGITYALYNGRDKQVADFTKELFPIFDELTTDLSGYTAIEFLKISADTRKSIGQIPDNDPDKATKEKTIYDRQLKTQQSLQAANDALLNGEDLDPTDTAAIAYLAAMKAHASTNGLSLVKSDGTPVSTLADAAEHVNLMADKLYVQLEGKPLLTLAVNGTSDNTGKFDQVSAGMVFLQGIKKSDFELDLRARFSYADTLEINLPRAAFDASAGMNVVLGKKENSVDRATGDQKHILKVKRSYFEVKGYVEYVAILNNPMPDEQENTFYANADFRLRIADDLWIPFTLKYDVENANLLGFLNITFNFD